MSQTPDLIDADGEVRELTAKDLALFRPAAEVLPSALMTKLTPPPPPTTIQGASKA